MQSDNELTDALVNSLPGNTLYSIHRKLFTALEKIRQEEVDRYKKTLSGPDLNLAEGFSTAYVHVVCHATFMKVAALLEKNCELETMGIFGELFSPLTPLPRKFGK